MPSSDPHPSLSPQLPLLQAKQALRGYLHAWPLVWPFSVKTKHQCQYFKPVDCSHRCLQTPHCCAICWFPSVLPCLCPHTPQPWSAWPETPLSLAPLAHSFGTDLLSTTSKHGKPDNFPPCESAWARPNPHHTPRSSILYICKEPPELQELNTTNTCGRTQDPSPPGLNSYLPGKVKGSFPRVQGTCDCLFGVYFPGPVVSTHSTGCFVLFLNEYVSFVREKKCFGAKKPHQLL